MNKLDNYNKFIHLSRYARWDENKKRRETWDETVERYTSFFKNKFEDIYPKELVQDAIKNLDVMPSMRCLMSAGLALERDNASGYNCSALAIDHPRAFDEILYILMVGCFSGDTQIATEKGYKNISELTINDKVLTYDPKTKTYFYTNPLTVVETDSADVKKVKITFEDQSTIKCTIDHQFLTRRGWVEAHNLSKEDFIINYFNDMRILSIEEIEDKQNYYDLTIKGTQNYVLSNGCVAHNCGVGFSVERQFICNLPTINEDFHEVDSIIQVHDSKIGWATAFRQLIALLYAGQIPKWDLSKIRPKGSKLKVFGGRASGPEPLDELFHFAVKLFRNAAGRKLNSIECHDLVCKIASTVVVGGVRRCLKYDTQVKMSNGTWREIKDLTVGEEVRLPNGSSTPITNIFHNGKAEIVNVYLEDGTFFECTEDHRWFVLDLKTKETKWVKTSELSYNKYAMIDFS